MSVNWGNAFKWVVTAEQEGFSALQTEGTPAWQTALEPTQRSELVGNKARFQAIKSWFDHHGNTEDSGVLMIEGCSGTGKTAVVHLEANLRGLKLEQLGPDEIRTGPVVEAAIKAAASQNTVLFLDDADAMCETESAGFAVLTKYLKAKALRAVLCVTTGGLSRSTTESTGMRALKTLRNVSTVVTLQHLSAKDTAGFLQKSAERQGHKLPLQESKALAADCKDVRQALNQLQFAAVSRSSYQSCVGDCEAAADDDVDAELLGLSIWTDYVSNKAGCDMGSFSTALSDMDLVLTNSSEAETLCTSYLRQHLQLAGLSVHQVLDSANKSSKFKKLRVCQDVLDEK